MYFNTMKRWGAIALAGTLAFSLAGCGGRKNDNQNEEAAESSTEAAVVENDTDKEEYVDGDVTLPSDFGDMIYPLTALMVESYAKELPYYNEDSEEDEADSFWFSMAVLTSLVNDYVKDVTVDTDETYLYLEEETVNMYASVLYDAYAQGNLEFPELSEDDTYAVYDEDEGTYGFLAGGIGSLEAVITDCEAEGDSYVLTAELRDSDDDDSVCGTYEITMVPTSYDGEENIFNYSVSDFEEREASGDGVDFSETEEQDDDDDDAAESSTEEGSTEETEEDDTDEEASASGTSTSRISRDQALELAQEYYGDDAEYTYKAIITVGDYQYYNFSVEGEGVTSTDVLVSTDGENVLGGVQNDDGSWSFDQ